MKTGPICHLCGAVVPTVSWVTIEVDASPEPSGRADPLTQGAPAPRDGEGAADPAPEDVSAATGPGGREVGLCPDCLSAARARGRLLAPVIPLRTAQRRRRRAPE